MFEQLLRCMKILTKVFGESVAITITPSGGYFTIAVLLYIDTKDGVVQVSAATDFSEDDIITSPIDWAWAAVESLNDQVQAVYNEAKNRAGESS